MIKRMKSRRVLFTTVLALLCVTAFAVTAFAQAMEGPDESEVYEGGDVNVTFNSPAGGGMEGSVSAANLSFNAITTNNMGSTLSDENHVFSLFGDPVTYNYTVSASAGEQVSVSLRDAEQSDAEGNLSQVPDSTWSATVKASSTPAPPTNDPTDDPTNNPTDDPTNDPTDSPGRPTPTLPPIPTIDPSGSPAPGAPGIIGDNNNNNNINSNNGNTTNSNNTTYIYNTTYTAVRYPAYAPRPVYQRTVSRSYDGMPKMGDTTTTNYWALLTMGALLCVIIIVAATQLYAHSTKHRRVNVTIMH